MKLIVLQPYLTLRGGMERVILKVAEHYKAKIYTLEYDKNRTFDGFSDLDIDIIGKDIPFSNVLPYRASQGLKYGYSFYNLKISEDYDVLNPHMSPSEWIRHKNERVMWYCHTPPREVYDLYAVRMKNRSYRDKILYATFAKAYKFIAHGLTDRIEEVAVNSKTTQEKVKKYYSRNSVVVNPGIDYELFRNDGDEKYFFYPSRIILTKRQDYVIDAFRRFVKKTGRKDFRLVLAGTLSRDPEHVEYYNRIKNMAKGLKVTIKTDVNDSVLRDLYSGSTAVLFAAINEDFGLIPLESMASSKPIISVNEGGTRETIANNKTGFLVNSPGEMAEKMKFIAEHRDVAERMGKEGRRKVEKEHSWRTFFEKIDPLFRKVSKMES